MVCTILGNRTRGKIQNRCGCFSVKTHAKTKELDPVGRHPLNPPMTGSFNALADLHTKISGTHPPSMGPNSFVFNTFSPKSAHIGGTCPPRNGPMPPPRWEVLNLPLQWYFIWQKILTYLGPFLGRNVAHTTASRCCLIRKVNEKSLKSDNINVIGLTFPERGVALKFSWRIHLNC